MTVSASDAVDLGKSIIAEFHRYFVSDGADNYDHVMAIRRIITAISSHFPDGAAEVERNLFDYGLRLFQEEWLRQAVEDEDDCDKKEELKEATGVFRKIYKTGKDAP